MKKKLISWLLVFGLTLCLLPVAALAAEAEDLEDSGYTMLLDTDDYSVWTKEDTTVSPSYHAWTRSGGSYDSGNRNIKNSFSTLAILCEVDGVLKFDWVVGSVAKFGYFAYRLNGDYTSSGAVTGQADHKYTGDDAGSEDGIQVEEGDVLYLTFFKNNFEKHDLLKDGATVSDIRIVSGGTVSVVSSNADLGTVSWDLDSLEDIPAGTILTVTATAVSGQFAGWYETIGGMTRLLSMDSVFEYTVSEDAALEARFAAFSQDTVATFNGTEYDDLQDALDAAGASGTTAMVILQQDVEIDDDITIPANVTLLIPYAGDDTGVDFSDTEALKEKVNRGIAYRTLTLNGDLTVNGTILVNARLGSSSTGHQGTIAGDYGHLILNGEATVNDGGAFKVLGMVTGTGSIDTLSGGALYQPFEMTDWPGGTTGLGLYSEANEFPINQYYIQNIQVTTVIEYGASMNAYAYLLVPSMHLGVQVVMDGLISDSNSAFFKMGEGSCLTLEYDPNKCQTGVTVEGEVDLQAFSISAVGQSISTDGVICPIPNGFDITLADGADVTIANDFKLLPGSGLTVGEGATLTLAEGATVEIYGAEDFTPFYGSYPALPSSAEASSIGTLSGAQVTIDGTLVNNGTIKISDTEEVFDADSGTVSGTGTIVEVAVGKIVVHYDANGGTGTMADQRLTYGKSGSLSANAFTWAGHNFLGWSAMPDMDYNPLDGSASLVPDAISFDLLPNVGIDAMTLYARWEENENEVFIVAFVDEDGTTVLADSQEVESGWTVTEPVPAPEKEGYTFAGWYNGDTEYVFTTPVTGPLTLTAHWEETPAATLTLENFTNGTKGAATVEVVDATAGTFTVTCAYPCAVAINNGDGTWTKLKATAVTGETNKYSFAIGTEFDSSIEILVAIKGDLNRSGSITSGDYTMLKRLIAHTVTTLEPVQLLAADVNADGNIKSGDYTMLKRVIAHTYTLKW